MTARVLALVLAAVGGAALAGPAASARGSVVTAVADQRVELFDDPWFQSTNVTHVKLVVPWDAGLRDGPWKAWLARARAAGLNVLVAFEHDERSQCPDAPCRAVAIGEYRRALRAFLHRYPWVRTFVAWNEPNHSSQPTFARPSLAAAYYRAARRTCAQCTIVAGAMLDDDVLPSYLSAYRAALDEDPAVWGLQNYYDATYFESRGTDLVLSQTTGELWLTETGGIVSFGTLGYDEVRARDSVRWLYALAAARPRLTRMYLYQWRGSADNGFDSGLLGYDGSPRPAFRVVQAHAGVRSARGTRHTAARAGTRVRRAVIAGRAVRRRRNRTLLVDVRCLKGAPAHKHCTGRLSVHAAGARSSAGFDVPQGAAATIAVHFGPKRWARVPRTRVRAVARICRLGGQCRPAVPLRSGGRRLPS